MCDPRELPGLAHFCEHMLFLGTERCERDKEYKERDNAGMDRIADKIPNLISGP